MRGKRPDVCHTCRHHKIGCDGARPACSQCRLTRRECGGYRQDLVILQHKPSRCRLRKKQKNCNETTTWQNDAQCPSNPSIKNDLAGHQSRCDLQQPTYDECVAVLVQHYIPKDEIPFLSQVEPSKSRICGGWVQALPHVSQEHEDFEWIVSPAVRALTMSMTVTGTGRRQEYLDTYGHALQGIRNVLYRPTTAVEPTVAIASMCLALSEVLVPTSNDGYKTHLRGVAAMMQSRGPYAFKNGVAHLMFVGVRPLIVIDTILRRGTTFLMDEQWRSIPFSVHRASRMQVLLGHAMNILPLLAATSVDGPDEESIRSGFLGVLTSLQDWEDAYSEDGAVYQEIAPTELDLAIYSQRLPSPCFSFIDVSHANSLTHCWAFRIVCLMQLSKLEQPLIPGNQDDQSNCSSAYGRYESISNLCTRICRGLPYLLQKEMSLYGSMSAGFPLHMVSESLQVLQLQDQSLGGWCTAIKEQVQSQRVALYEEMAGTGPLAQ